MGNRSCCAPGKLAPGKVVCEDWATADAVASGREMAAAANRTAAMERCGVVTVGGVVLGVAPTVLRVCFSVIRSFMTLPEE